MATEPKVEYCRL